MENVLFKQIGFKTPGKRRPASVLLHHFTFAIKSTFAFAFLVLIALFLTPFSIPSYAIVLAIYIVGEFIGSLFSALAPASQARMDELLDRNAQAQLDPNELSELDRLLRQVDQLNVLKTRARYTRRQQAKSAGS